jgi:GxxExxY protein
MAKTTWPLAILAILMSVRLHPQGPIDPIVPFIRVPLTAENAESAEILVISLRPLRSPRLKSGPEQTMKLNDLTSAIIGAAIKVHRILGPGLLESAYRACLAYELKKLGFRVEEEKPIPVVYQEVKLECGFRADLLVEGLVIVECKAKEKRIVNNYREE